MPDNADVKSDSAVTLFKAAADEVTFSGDVAKVQLVRQVTVAGAEGSKTVVDITPSNDYTHDSLLTPSTTAGPALVGRGTDGTNAAVSAVNNAVLLIATLLGKLITWPYAHPSKTWNYAAPAGGLVTNAAPVQIKAAAGAGIRNYITSIQMANSHQTIGTEVGVREVGTGIVHWRMWAQFQGGGAGPAMPVNIRPAANVALEIFEVTTTAGAGVLFNCQGHESAE